MRPKHRKVKLICTVVALSLCLHLASCGFLLYPERRGQTHGRIDPAIAVLDGVGLLLFLIPGIVAFAIDFGAGTIYLPSSKKASTTSPETDDMMVIRVKPGDLSKQKIEKIVETHTGYPLSFDQDNLRAYVLDEKEFTEAEIQRLARFWKQVPIRDMVAHQRNY